MTYKLLDRVCSCGRMCNTNKHAPRDMDLGIPNEVDDKHVRATYTKILSLMYTDCYYKLLKLLVATLVTSAVINYVLTLVDFICEI